MKQHTFNDIVGYSDLEINTRKKNNYECIIVFIDQLTILMQTFDETSKKYGSESDSILMIAVSVL